MFLSSWATYARRRCYLDAIAILNLLFVYRPSVYVVGLLGYFLVGYLPAHIKVLEVFSLAVWLLNCKQ